MAHDVLSKHISSMMRGQRAAEAALPDAETRPNKSQSNSMQQYMQVNGYTEPFNAHQDMESMPPSLLPKT